MNCQDWTTVTVKRRTNANAANAKRPTFSGEAVQIRKLENEEVPKIRSISNASRQQIVQARVLHKWNQSQLNVACAFPSNMIRDIESGKIQPNPHQLTTLSRVLNIVLKYD